MVVSTHIYYMYEKTYQSFCVMIQLHFLHHHEDPCGMGHITRHMQHSHCHASEMTKPAINNRKRSTERASETLESLLEGVKASLLRVREHCHHFMLASCTGSRSSCGDTEWFIDEGTNDTMQNSIMHFMQCCLYMYNAMEEGLDYLEDPAAGIQCRGFQVICTLPSVLHRVRDCSFICKASK